MQHSPFEQLITDLTPLYGAGEARSIARIVLEDAFNTRRYTEFRCETAGDAEKMASISAALLQGVPVQYVLGEADFFGLKFQVNPSVLIPRQETEELVAAILEQLKQFPNGARVLDIGLGSGCIGITIKYKRPDIQLFGFEKSPEALQTALSNAARLLKPGNDVHFLQSDILLRQPEPDEQYDLIVSNPPYIPKNEAAIMPDHVVHHEPALALFVEDDDPLLFYKVIAAYARKTLAHGGSLYFECNEFNAGEVAAFLNQQNFQSVQLLKDLSGADRIVSARYD